MKTQTWLGFLKLGVIASALQPAMYAAADDQHGGNRGDDEHGRVRAQLQLPSGQYITPTAISGAFQQLLNPGLPAYPNFVAGEAVKSQLSPDGSTLAILCAGQNSLFKASGAAVDAANSTQYIFLYNVAGANRARPVLSQVIKQPNAHVGLVFSGNNVLYAAGGNDDAVYEYTKSAGAWAQSAKIALGHAGKGVGLFGVQPNASGIGLSVDGRTLVVANNYNDSISVIDTASRTVRYEHDLRPFGANNEGTAGGVGGTFPFAVVVKGNGVAYVSSDRDREVVVVDISSPTAGRLIKRIKLDGNALGMTLDAAQAKLYVAQDNADQVAVIDTASNSVITRIDARAPSGILTRNNDDGDREVEESAAARLEARSIFRRNDAGDREAGEGDDHRGPDRRAHFTGVATFTVTLSRDGNTLYAVNAGANSVAVIPLTGPMANKVSGLIPTAYDPHDITFSPDGAWMYLVNGKNITGPNPTRLSFNTGAITSFSYPGTGTTAENNAAATAAANAGNQYQFQLERASLVSAPVPTSADLAELTARVARNNFYSAEPVENDLRVMQFLRDRIQHVIYVVKENRTFDQVLGDLTNGANADPKLTQFGQALTPNNHRLAASFVTLDNFMHPGDGSMDGWSWAMQGRVTNTETITQQINYAFVDRGLSYESEGTNRNVPVNFGTIPERDAVGGAPGNNYSTLSAGQVGGTVNLLTGTGNHASSDAPFGIQKGYIFNAVLQAGKTVRNYGFLVNNIGSIGTIAAPVSNPFASGIVQVAPLDPALAPLTDVYFRGYDQRYPDLWRYNEWKREFDQFVANGNLPNLSLVRISHDHMGNFSTALGGVNTPETQQADCDLALGRLVEAVANSPFASSTLIIVTEDDVQDGPDHVDSHRGPAFVIGPYVKQGAVVGTRYSQVNALRTIEDVLGTQHINLNTAFQRPMADAFDIHSSGAWSYSAVASTVLKTTTLALATPGENGVQFATGPNVKPKHNAAYWERVTAGMDFSEADQVPTFKFNKVLWTGLKGGKPYPGPFPNGRAAQRKDD
jgi:YVTN family beta-propeller protein